MLRDRIRELIQQAIVDLQRDGTLPGSKVPQFSVEAPENPAHGDYATNAALVLAKAAKRKPMEITEVLAEKLRAYGAEILANVHTAPPGFINLSIVDEVLVSSLPVILADPAAVGTIGRDELTLWRSKKVILEFTDPNPFKEFHIGHLYSNIVGESLARMFEAVGAEVKRANYQGDVGLHVARAVWGMQKKMAEDGIGLAALEARDLAERIKFMGQAYADGAKAFDGDEEVKGEITALNKKIFELDPEIRELYEKGRAWSLEYFEQVYRRLGTKFDFYYFERDVGQVGLDLVRDNLAKGVFEESEGAVVFPGERFGLHRRVFINSQGLPTYEAKELGLAPKKYKDFAYDLSVVITGNEIIDYFKVIIVALKQIYPELGEKTLHIAHGMVRLAAGKMSSRTGEVVRAEELLDEVKRRAIGIMERSEKAAPIRDKDAVAEAVAVGAVKYSLLKVGIGKDIVFDIDTSLNLEGDSGPYLQYTHARLKSILRKAARDAKVSNAATVPESTALDAGEHRLLAAMLRLPEAIEDALKDYTPNTLANYLYGLAKLANEFYHSHPVIQEPNEAKREARIAIVSGVALTLARGLGLLGIEAPEEM